MAAPVKCEAAAVKGAVNAAGVVAEVVALINAGDAATLHARFGAQLQAAVPLETLKEMLAAIVEQRGKLTGAGADRGDGARGTFALTAERGCVEAGGRARRGGRDRGAAARRAGRGAPPVARSAPAGLPFRGEWLVFWGESGQRTITTSARRRSGARRTW